MPEFWFFFFFLGGLKLEIRIDVQGITYIGLFLEKFHMFSLYKSTILRSYFIHLIYTFFLFLTHFLHNFISL